MKDSRDPLIQRASLTAAAVVASMVITALFSLGFHGRIELDFIVTAFSCSLIVAWLVIGRLQRMRQSLAEALERERALTVRAEKMRTLRQTMHKVQHHVNNLAAGLQVVELEYEDTHALTESTISRLRKAIADTSRDMEALGDLDDPFDDEAFQIRV